MSFAHTCSECDGTGRVGRIAPGGNGTLFVHDTYFTCSPPAWLTRFAPAWLARAVMAVLAPIARRRMERALRRAGKPFLLQALGHPSAVPEDDGPKPCSACTGTGTAPGHHGKDPRACDACARARADLAPLVALLRQCLRPALQLRLQPSTDAESLPTIGTHFGGPPYAEPGETWPVCPGCGGSLTFIGQFDPRAVWTPLGQTTALCTFFYCWTCGPWGLDSDVVGSWVVRSYATPDAARAVRITPAEPPPQVTTPCSVRAEAFDSHPDWDEVEWRHPELHALAARLAPAEPSAAYRAAVHTAVGDYRITTQLGGFGRWIQSAPRCRCRECGESLGLVLQIDSLSEAGCEWGLPGLAYLLCCPKHTARWALQIQCT